MYDLVNYIRSTRYASNTECIHQFPFTYIHSSDYFAFFFLQLVEVSVTLISQVLYEVAEISNAKQIESLLPSGLDSRLQQLISTVRSINVQVLEGTVNNSLDNFLGYTVKDNNFHTHHDLNFRNEYLPLIFSFHRLYLQVYLPGGKQRSIIVFLYLVLKVYPGEQMQ